ncbi:MAG TPA: DNA methyltransferase [Candidatus Brocadiales bacterium]|nr:DNA methyltransferase [Candidatus Brocadiales bacterium]
MENILYYGDNLKVLREHIKDNSVDLIYLDPPFNSKADYNILFKEPTGKPSEAQITAFEDTWHWTEETERTFQEIVEIAPANVVEMIRAFRQFVGNNDVMAYLTMMCVRLLELKRVLKDTGSIYLHCDPTASHYLKIVMDTIFGKKNFRNEIIWSYSQGGKSRQHWARKHDVILFYSKSPNYKFDNTGVREPFTPHKRSSTGSYGGRMGTDENGRPYVEKWGTGKKKLYRDYLDEGKIPEDVWEIQSIQAGAKQRIGYPTQKPEALLERIIKASSDKDSIVLDPFCGCGTTVAVAQRFKRNWIGIDITHLAINLIKLRLKDMYRLEPKKDYKIVGEPEDLAGAKELALQNRYQFQWWALSLIDIRPYGDKKKGADTGIDGISYFMEGKDEYKKIIAQVKSGNVSVKDIRDFCHVLDRENAERGIFVTLEQPTKPMVTEAVSKGFYKSPHYNKNFPKIQILTIEEILNGTTPDIPFLLPSYKKAQRANLTKDSQLKLLRRI